jgi:hypothetical protein
MAVGLITPQARLEAIAIQEKSDSKITPQK